MSTYIAMGKQHWTKDADGHAALERLFEDLYYEVSLGDRLYVYFIDGADEDTVSVDEMGMIHYPQHCKIEKLCVTVTAGILDKVLEAQKHYYLMNDAKSDILSRVDDKYELDELY